MSQQLMPNFSMGRLSEDSEPDAHRPPSPKRSRSEFQINHTTSAAAIASSGARVGAAGMYPTETNIWRSTFDEVKQRHWSICAEDVTEENVTAFIGSVFHQTKAHGTLKKARAFINHILQETGQRAYNKKLDGQILYPKYHNAIQNIVRSPEYLAAKVKKAGAHNSQQTTEIFNRFNDIFKESNNQPNADTLNSLVLYTIGITCAMRVDDIYKLDIGKFVYSIDKARGDGRRTSENVIEPSAELQQAGSKNVQGAPLWKDLTCICNDHSTADTNPQQRDRFDCPFHIVEMYLNILRAPPLNKTSGRLVHNKHTAPAQAHLLKNQTMGIGTMRH